MPTVPTYDSAQVMPTNGPAPYRQPDNVDTQGTARQFAVEGAALQNLGAVRTQEEVYAQTMANQVRIDDGENEAIKEKLRLTNDPVDGFLNKKGAAALDPDSQGQSLQQRYTAQLQTKLSQISDSLGNDAQRRVFNQRAALMLNEFSGDVQRHVLQEYHNFGLETQQGTVNLASDQAKLNWNDPDRVAEQVRSASAAVWKAGQINGEPANLTADKIKETTSAIHTGVIAAAIQNDNPAYAQQYLDLNKGGMTADDILKVTGLVNHGVDTRVALGAVRDATTKLSTQIQPSDLDRLNNIVMGMESGGNPNAVGPNVPGQGTAKGSMQVMDATNGNPGYGVTPAKDDSPEERARVGRDFLAAMVTKYGNPAQAMAAYNAGPGKVDAAIASAQKSGGNWLAAMPQETQDYVHKGMATLSAGGGTQVFPTESQFVQTALDALGQNPRLEQVRMTREQAAAQYAMLDKSRREQGDQAVLSAQRELVQNGGNFAVLTPQTRANVVRYAPDKYDNLMDFAKKIATGNTTTNMAAYLDAVANTDELAKMPQSTFNHFVMTNFSPDDAKHIANLRQDELASPGNGEGTINRPALNTALNSRLEAIGINPAPKDLGEKARVGSIQKFVTDGIFAQQQQLGRKMTAQEVSDYVDQTMAKNVTFRNTFLGVQTGTAQQPLMSMKVGDIPDDSLAAIRAAFAKRGNTHPTDDQILRTYWTAKNAK